jgi:hypothetical protein
MRYKPTHRIPKLSNEPQNSCPKVLFGWREKRKIYVCWALLSNNKKHLL